MPLLFDFDMLLNFIVVYNFIVVDIEGSYISYVGYAVAQLVEALHYKPEGRGFDSRWCQWNFSLT